MAAPELCPRRDVACCLLDTASTAEVYQRDKMDEGGLMHGDGGGVSR